MAVSKFVCLAGMLLLVVLASIFGSYLGHILNPEVGYSHIDNLGQSAGKPIKKQFAIMSKARGI